MIDYNQVLYIDHYFFKEWDPVKRRHALSYAAKSLFYTGFRFPSKRKADFLFFRSLVRDDYKLFFNQVHGVVHERDKIVIEDHVCKTTKIAPRAILLLIALVPKLFSYNADGLFERIYLYLKLCFYYRQLAAVSKIKFKHLIVFADMQPEDNLLAQYYRKRGKNTITLQHGLYVDYQDYPTVNIVNYLHQPSEYFLSWGDNTANLIKKYHNSHKIITCGKVSLSITPSRDEQSHIQNTSYITVVLDQNIFEEKNKDMLKIAANYAVEKSLLMNVRFHPDNIRRNYDDLGINFIDNLPIDDSKLVIGHTSSLLYEIMALGIPVYKFASNIPYIELPRELIFSTLSELAQKTENTINFKVISKKYIECTGRESLSRYRKFFQMLNQQKFNNSIE